MKLIKKLLIFTILILIIPFISGCDFVIYTTTSSNTTTIATTSFPTDVNGSIYYTDQDYENFPTYTSPTYQLTDINEYNQVLFDTKYLIRHANVQVVNTKWYNSFKRLIVGTSYGSGFIFKEDDQYYYALTNYHVINPDGYYSEYEIKAFGDTDLSKGIIVDYDSDMDLAVIKFLKGTRSEITMINIYNRLNYKFNPGELVLAVGNPQELTNNVTFGEFISMQTIENADFKVIYHDASIHEGSSGGALVDVDGNLLGINTWGVDSPEDYSFAIPNYIVYEFLVNKGILD